MKLAASFLLAFPFLSDVVVGQQEELYLGVYNATDVSKPAAKMVRQDLASTQLNSTQLNFSSFTT
jgi:hypothetical protein